MGGCVLCGRQRDEHDDRVCSFGFTPESERLVCPDCEQSIVVEIMAGYIMGSRCGCAEKHYAEQDRQTFARLAHIKESKES